MGKLAEVETFQGDGQRAATRLAACYLTGWFVQYLLLSAIPVVTGDGGNSRVGMTNV
jgi:hypothetical protein